MCGIELNGPELLAISFGPESSGCFRGIRSAHPLRNIPGSSTGENLGIFGFVLADPTRGWQNKKIRRQVIDGWELSEFHDSYKHTTAGSEVSVARLPFHGFLACDGGIEHDFTAALH